MSTIIAVLVGVLAGTHTSTWGMYKDAIHEGFTWRKYRRSILLSSALAPLLVHVLGLPVQRAGDLLILFGVCYVLERAVAEFYKTFVREEDQSKYFIPMQFAVGGRVISSRRTRALAGVAVAGSALALLVTLVMLQPLIRPSTFLVALAGSLGGWFSAVGGAWKDAPLEGFQLLKFLRSPVLATAYTMVLFNFTNSVVLAALAGLGFTIATIETYKTFFFPGRPRGKFAGKPILHPDMLVRRNWFLPVYIAIWLLLLTGFAAAWL
jgi:hypothetical protein